MLIMQLLGGGFFLLQKVFLSIAERSERKRPTDKRWRVYAWIAYLIGLPPWTAVLVWHHNWIAAALGLGAAPAMVLGLTIALRGKGQKIVWLDRLSIIAVIAGMVYSLHDFGGFTSLSQILELGIAASFLVGTYLLANKKPIGYLWYVLLCSFTAALMWVNHHPLLVAQQIVSLGFVVDAYLAQRRKARPA